MTAKTVFITGASSGIGLACANKFARNNFNVVLCSRNYTELEKIKVELEKFGTKISIFKMDVKNSHQVKDVFDELSRLSIVIDILINNAGLALDLSDLQNGKTDDWDDMIDTNIKGLLYVTRFTLAEMIKNNHGHIINIGSIAGINSYAKGAVYAATKSAVKFISDGIRKEVVENNIKVTNIQPGLVETNFSMVRFSGDLEKAKNVYKGIQPLTANDIAETIFFVANTPEHVQICEVTLTPLHQASVEVVFRN